MSNHITGDRVKRGGLLGMLVIALTGCGGGSGASTPVPVQVPDVPAPVVQVSSGTWVVMGSSTAAGAGAPAGKGWVDLLKAALTAHGAQFTNIAMGGSVTYHGLSESVPVVAGRPAPNPAANIDQALSRKPVALIVSYPSNDTAHRYGSDEPVNNVLSIRANALTAGVPVVVTSSQPRNLSSDQLGQLKEIDRRLAAIVQGCFVDVRTVLAAPDGRMASQFDSGDGVHPNAAGHEQIAIKVRQTLESGTCVHLPAKNR